MTTSSPTTASDSNPNPQTVLPTTPHTHTIIFLHGRGSSAATFHSEIFESQDSSSAYFPSLFPSAKWGFPCAPQSLATTDGNDLRHQWFDMASVQEPWRAPELAAPGLRESAARIVELVQKEAEEVGGLERVFVAGISQGCAVGLYTLVKYDLCVGGFVGICGWVAGRGELDRLFEEEGRRDVVKKVPVLLQHCADDFVVPVENGRDMKVWLEGKGMQVRWEELEEGGHWLNEPRGMDGVVRFMRDVMKGSDDLTTVVAS